MIHDLFIIHLIFTLAQGWSILFTPAKNIGNIKNLVFFQGVAGFLLSIILFVGIGEGVLSCSLSPVFNWWSDEPIFFVADRGRLSFIVLGHLLYLLCLIYKQPQQDCLSWSKSVNTDIPQENSPSHHAPKIFYAFLGVLHSVVILFFYADDIILLYMFAEAAMVPVLFLVGLFGGEGRIKACYKIFMYTVLGSAFGVLSLLQIINLGQTSNLKILVEVLPQLSNETQQWLALGLFIPFAIKAAIWPFHHWLPDVHYEAPAVGSVMLAGIVLKMGGFGLLIVGKLFPGSCSIMLPILYVIVIIGVVGMGLATLGQLYWKKMIAYASIGHMSYIALGAFLPTPAAKAGAFFHLISHGLISPGLFFLYAMAHQRFGFKKISDYGGMATILPVFAIAMMVMIFANLGLPGTSGFVGEFFLLYASFANSPIKTMVMLLGFVIAAVYSLHLAQKVLWGPCHLKQAPCQTKSFGAITLTYDEYIILGILVALILGLGIWPKPLLHIGGIDG